MAIHTDEDQVELICDSCEKTTTGSYAREEYDEMIRAAKELGISFSRVSTRFSPGQWQHKCRACRVKEVEDLLSAPSTTEDLV